MLHLHPMDDGTFAQFLAHTVPQYAAEKVRNGQWTPDEAQDRAEAEYQQLLPQGLNTPDQFLFSLLDPSVGAPVGVLWYGLQHRTNGTAAFIYEIEVFEAYRRRGYATQAFAALETDAAARGTTSLHLHVFGHNTGARALYERLGFQVTNVNMKKELTDTVQTPAS
ncbi:GNAT family N-acetyltransferase [Deinococcus sp. HMF7620]|uniref:GNAT family N-acetyltransferase n=1 Tax=Deinococcus arboris TaxID=2682977 RepID=A0A7C9M756_9DEIO|nr:GNAT family N-acetyltransferase [Deinococcus arboris]MVN87645.1 GNAT family N-acetyltransferase [Deinococcus arboris]